MAPIPKIHGLHHGVRTQCQSPKNHHQVGVSSSDSDTFTSEWWNSCQKCAHPLRTISSQERIKLSHSYIISKYIWYDILKDSKSHKKSPFPGFGAQGVQHHAAVSIDASNLPNIACGGKHKKLGSSRSKSEVYAIRNTKNRAVHDLYGKYRSQHHKAKSQRSLSSYSNYLATTYGISTWTYGHVWTPWACSRTFGHILRSKTLFKSKKNRKLHWKALKISENEYVSDCIMFGNLKAYSEIQNGRILRVNAADKSKRANCIQLPPLSCLTREPVWVYFETWVGG